MEEAAALKERGNVCARSGKLQEAANLYSDAAGLAQAVSGSEAKKLAALCFSNKAQMLLQLKQFAEVVDIASKAIELDPSYAKSYFRRGSAYEHLKQTKLSFSDYWRAHTLERENERILESMYRVILKYDGKLETGVMRVGYAWASLAEAMRLAQLKQFEQAADLMYNFVLGGYSQAAPSPPPDLLADLVLHVARHQTGTPVAQVLLAFFLSGAKPADACAELDKLLNASASVPPPRLADVYIMRGFLRGTMNDADGALADFSRALEIEPSNTRALYLRGKALRFARCFADAIADWKQAVTLLDDSEFGLADMVYELCGLMLQEREPVEAVEAYLQKAVRAEQAHSREYGEPQQPWQYRSMVLRMLAARKGMEVPASAAVAQRKGAELTELPATAESTGSAAAAAGAAPSQ